ncbi:hypothetical protein M569_00689, partial [Genlisea aurea]
LRDITPAAENNVNARFILLDKARPTAEEGPQHRKCLALAADETAAVHFQLWGDECDAFNPGDIVLLTDGIFSYDRNQDAVLRAGRRGRVQKLGEFCMNFVETPNLSEIKWAPHPSDPKNYAAVSVVSPYSRLFPPL